MRLSRDVIVGVLSAAVWLAGSASVVAAMGPRHRESSPMPVFWAPAVTIEVAVSPQERIRQRGRARDEQTTRPFRRDVTVPSTRG